MLALLKKKNQLERFISFSMLSVYLAGNYSAPQSLEELTH